MKNLTNIENTRHRPAHSAVLSMAMTALFAIGCGGREFAEVEGQITLEGKPLAEVEVLFLPDPAKGNQGNNASAFTDAQGHYTLLAPRDQRVGTVLGPHRVAITDLTMVVDTTGAGDVGKARGPSSGPTMPGTKPRRFPREYGDPMETPFQEIEIVSGKQVCNFELKTALKAEHRKPRGKDGGKKNGNNESHGAHEKKANEDKERRHEKQGK